MSACGEEIAASGLAVTVLNQPEDMLELLARVQIFALGEKVSLFCEWVTISQRGESADGILAETT